MSDVGIFFIVVGHKTKRKADHFLLHNYSLRPLKLKFTDLVQRHVSKLEKL